MALIKLIWPFYVDCDACKYRILKGLISDDIKQTEIQDKVFKVVEKCPFLHICLKSDVLTLILNCYVNQAGSVLTGYITTPHYVTREFFLFVSK